ncbi:hypothetical protein M885DRAFT_605269, partial [Pelagophyceae sp. CCMP2097]
ETAPFETRPLSTAPFQKTPFQKAPFQKAPFQKAPFSKNTFSKSTFSKSTFSKSTFYKNPLFKRRLFKKHLFKKHLFKRHLFKKNLFKKNLFKRHLFKSAFSKCAFSRSTFSKSTFFKKHLFKRHLFKKQFFKNHLFKKHLFKKHLFKKRLFKKHLFKKHLFKRRLFKRHLFKSPFSKCAFSRSTLSNGSKCGHFGKVPFQKGPNGHLFKGRFAVPLECEGVGVGFPESRLSRRTPRLETRQTGEGTLETGSTRGSDRGTRAAPIAAPNATSARGPSIGTLRERSEAKDDASGAHPPGPILRAPKTERSALGRTVIETAVARLRPGRMLPRSVAPRIADRIQGSLHVFGQGGSQKQGGSMRGPFLQRRSPAQNGPEDSILASWTGGTVGRRGAQARSTFEAPSRERSLLSPTRGHLFRRFLFGSRNAVDSTVWLPGHLGVAETTSFHPATRRFPEPPQRPPRRLCVVRCSRDF